MTFNVAEIILSATDKTQEGFNSARTAMESLREHAGKLAAALGVGMFAAMLKESLSAADHMGKMAQSVGVSVESLSRLSLSAKLSDVDMDSLAKSMGKLDKNIVEASQGTGMAASAFDYLGIHVRDAHGHLKNSDEVMKEVADKFAGLQDGAGKTTLSMAIFGKAGQEMIPMLNKGSGELKQNAEMAEKLGLALSTQTAAAAEEVNDRFALMGQASKGLVNHAMVELLPTIQKISALFIDNATDADNLKNKFAMLDAGIKSLVTVGITVKDVFEQIGKALGGTVAAIVLAMQGDFAGAGNALKEMSHDMVKTMTDDMEDVAKLWAENTAIPKAAADMAKKSIEWAGKEKQQAVKKIKDQESLDMITSLDEELKTHAAYLQYQEKNLQAQLGNMLISEKDFYTSKKQLALDDLQYQAGVLERELMLAKKAEDSKKAIEIEGKIARNKIAQDEAGGANEYDMKANKASISPFELEKKAYQARLDLADTYRKNKGDADGRARQMELDAQADYESKLNALIQRGAVSRNDFEAMSGKQQLQTHIAMLGNMLNASAQHSRAAFEAMKVVRLAEAAIALPSTIMHAYKSGMEAGGPSAPLLAQLTPRWLSPRRWCRSTRFSQPHSAAVQARVLRPVQAACPFPPCRDNSPIPMW